MTGVVTYRIPTFGAAASVATESDGRTRALFSHIATVDDFFTGVAAANTSTLAPNVRILAIDPKGEILGRFATVLRPRERISKLITELISAAADQTGGIIFVRSDFPVYLTSLFGTNGLKVLANIPPQTAPDSYAPDAGFEGIRVTPPLAFVLPGSSQTFQLENGGAGARWAVNSVEGGNADLGTITASGVYSAPAEAPTPRVLTITAQIDNQIAGASIDVIEAGNLFSSLSVVRSVAYLGSLARLYSAELSFLPPVTESKQTSGRTGQGALQTEILEIADPEGPRLSLATYSGEEVG